MQHYPCEQLSAEGFFSKLKLVKTKLRNVCGQEQLSDLLLLAIEKDGPTKKDKDIKFFQEKNKTKDILLGIEQARIYINSLQYFKYIFVISNYKVYYKSQLERSSEIKCEK